MPTYHIIIADDSDAVRAMLVQIIGRIYPTAAISPVPDGAEALRVYRQHGADLLITDQDMPRLRGLDLVRTLHAQQVTIPVILLSSDPSIQAQAQTAGVTLFLLKPFSVTQLTQVLRQILPP
jgi:CheY-like chemotaxis protein